MAGHIITMYFKEQGYDVTGFTRRPVPFCKNIIGDAMNPNDVKETIFRAQGEFSVDNTLLLTKYLSTTFRI